MLIKNCRIVEGDGNESLKNILIEDGKILRIFDSKVDLKWDEVIDAEGKYVLPGIVDVHTHMRDPGLKHKEDFESGSMACAKGGVTTFLDMPNTIPNTTTKQLLDEKREILKGKSYVDYGFHFGGSKNDNYLEIKAVEEKVASTKIFLNMSTGDMLVEEEEVLENLFKNSKIVSVHAEGDMVRRALELTKKFNGILYLCHLSTAEEVKLLKSAKKEGLKVYGEVTPHHLFLTKKDKEENPLLVMKPELKDKKDVMVLWDALRDGTIDSIATDHAPHLLKEKIEKESFGIPGVENSLELMLQAVREKRITMRKLIEVMSEKPAEIFKLRNKGKIKVGYDADLIIIDLEKNGEITGEDIISKCDWTPYKGLQKGGEVVTTIVRGNIVYNRGEFIKKIGREVIYE
jgi:dihydroorotase